MIDVNRIPSVLNPYVSDHEEFEPILKWIDSGKGKIVYGGTKYRTELGRLPKYFDMLSERKRAGQVCEVDDASVDAVQEEINRKIQHSNFNDQAIVAIVIVSRCRLVCSNDKRSFAFLTLKLLYPKGIKPPSIYTGRKNAAALLYHRHILGKCGLRYSSS